MAENARDPEAIFFAALEKTTPQGRAAYVEATCVGDPDLLQRVRELLVGHEGSQGPLDAPPPGLGCTVDMSATSEQPGTVIGPYRLLQQIGEGGMGTVFMAEQTHPVQRKVALKVIKPGMDSRQVIARFDAERQALALMDHVNIARVFDAGATEAGRPYFVMELVHGVPITKYCDDNRLTPRQRLELFVPVCQAIQHAHQKGIIHRDIKPSNVMITLYDGKPVPKVIDFGVSKATEQRLTERTLFTQYGTLVGTLEYMSPEQAEMSALGVDTRSDIYSLGVLLYELLTGNTPLSHQRVREAAYGEILRMIKEEEPPRPSTRLSDSGEALASISAQRHMEPAKLTKLVRGELDWIVMKTLEKDRNRRYETASDVAADIRRYLSDEPVEACPPSVGYRFTKFVRRNKAVIVPATALTVLTVVGLSVGLVLIARERDEARRQQRLANERLSLAIEAAHQTAMLHELPKGQDERAVKYRRAVVEKLFSYFQQYLETKPSLRLDVGGHYYRMGGQMRRDFGDQVLYEEALVKAQDLFEKSARESPNHPLTLGSLAFNSLRVGDLWFKKHDVARAEAYYRRSVATFERVARDFPEYLEDWCCLLLTVNPYGSLLRDSGRAREADELDLRVAAHFTRSYVVEDGFGRMIRDKLTILEGLPGLLVRCDQPRAAVEFLRRARPRLVQQAEYEAYASAVSLVADFVADGSAPDPSDLRTVKELTRGAIAMVPASPDLWLTLSRSLKAAGQELEAKTALRRTMELAAAADDLETISRRAWDLVTHPDPRANDPALALALGQWAVERWPQEGRLWRLLGVAYYRTGEWDRAIAALEKSMGLLSGGDPHQWFPLAMADARRGDAVQARAWYDRAVRWIEEEPARLRGHDDVRILRAEAEELMKEEPGKKPERP